jgi:uncharacterized paraquat-inducible protein A
MLRDRKTLSCRSFIGFAARTGVISSQTAIYVRCYEVLVPFWALVTIASLAPAFRIRRSLTMRHRQKHRHCPHCNYDLRASHDRCPECGHPIPPPPAADAPATTPAPKAP